jgi:hypothetical protein
VLDGGPHVVGVGPRLGVEYPITHLLSKAGGFECKDRHGAIIGICYSLVSFCRLGYDICVCSVPTLIPPRGLFGMIEEIRGPYNHCQK